jgi:pyruvate dehydrogenase E1 component alpha subunit
MLYVDTYRYRGHSMSDPATYRTKEEVNEIKNTRDPIMLVRKCLIENYKVKEKEIEKIEIEISETVEQAAEFALLSSEPDLSELTKDITL